MLNSEPPARRSNSAGIKLCQVTIHNIAATLNYPDPQAIRLQYKRLGLGEPPKPTAVLDPAKVVTLLTQMSVKNTRRTPEQAQAAAQLLAEFQTGKHQNGHLSESFVHNITGNDLPKRPKTEKKKRGASQPVVIPQPAPTNGKSHSGGWFQRVVAFLAAITLLDIVYVVIVFTASYGAWECLNRSVWGLSFAFVYSLVSFHAMGMAKNVHALKTARAGIAAVVILEIIAFFIHLAMANIGIVNAAKAGKLPFEYSFWGTLTMPFFIACVLAGILSGICIYSVSVTFSLTREKYNAEQKVIAYAKEQAEKQAEQARVRSEYLEQLRNRNL